MFRCDQSEVKWCGAHLGGQRTSGVIVLKDVTLPVGNLCIAPRFCSTFRD
jgi:hypothetical protein